MDKYELRIKSDQIKKLFEKGEYKTACKIADTIDFTKVKNISMLTMVGDIYECNHKYAEARDVYIIAYNKASVGRIVIQKLIEIDIRLGYYKEATDLIAELKEIVPDSSLTYILEYKLYKARGGSLDKRIELLEKYKEIDMDDRWMYELALLYARDNNFEKCSTLCDEIELWFCEGKYVNLAIELKKNHGKLTEEQQKKYNLAHIDEDAILDLEGNGDEKDFMKPVDISVDTLDMQQEIAQNMNNILDNSQYVPEEDNGENTIVDANMVLDKTMQFTKTMPSFLQNSVEKSNSDKVTTDTITKTKELDLNDIIKMSKEAEQKVTVEDVINMIKVEDIEEEKEDSTQEIKGTEINSEVTSSNEVKKEKDMIYKEILNEKDADTQSLPDILTVVGETQEFDAVDAPKDKPHTPVKSAVKTPDNLLQRIDKKYEAQDRINEAMKSVRHYVGISGMNEQLTLILQRINTEAMNGQIKSRNYVITGNPGNGKTSLAIAFIKAVRKLDDKSPKRIVKATSISINSKSIMDMAGRLENTNLVIEKAGKLSERSIHDITAIMNQNGSKMSVILEDSKEQMDKLFTNNPNLNAVFRYTINIPELTIKDYAYFGKEYAKKVGYTIDELGGLALHAKIDELFAIKRTIKIVDVCNIVDKAIDNAKKKKINKIRLFFNKNKIDEPEIKILKENDFEQINTINN